jgi:hypothetical protein
MRQKVCRSFASGVENAVKDVCDRLGSAANYDVILFCASTKYDFKKLSELLREKFSCGEISPDGFTDNGLVVTALSCSGSRVKGMIFADADKFLYIHRDEILRTAESCGIGKNSKDAFALTFICALHNCEENVLAVLHSVLGDELPVAGGSAGDDLKFSETFVSYNGKVVSDGAAILLFRTQDKFEIYRENIFKSTGRIVNVTEADPEKRIIRSIDNQNPLRRYAQIRGATESEVKQNMDFQMLGRVFGEHIFVSSMQAFNPDGTITLYSRILPNTPVEVLDAIDPIQVAQNTCQKIRGKVKNPGFVFMVNCIQRTIRFKNANIDSKLISMYSSAFGTFMGFTSYGEQINRIHSNSTFVILAVE